MINVRKSQERGHANHGWLDSYHTFSFANYYDPNHMGFRSLRVINEDTITPGAGFGAHPHRDMEIISYVLEGALEHKDSMGNIAVIRPGEVQRMTAGTGVVHSEYNHSQSESGHFLQIWIVPNQKNLDPGYEQKTYTDQEKRGKLRLIASQDGREGSVTIHQDVNLYATLLNSGEKTEHQVKPGRHLWLQVIKGKVTVNGLPLVGGDGAAITEENQLILTAQENTEALLFDLA